MRALLITLAVWVLGVLSVGIIGAACQVALGFPSWIVSIPGGLLVGIGSFALHERLSRP